MGKVYYNKLIRDKIPEKIKKNGAKYSIRPLTVDEFGCELFKKVQEEGIGLARANTREEFLDELADLLIVIDEIKKNEKITDEDVRKAKLANYKRKGGFKKRLFLNWSGDDTYRSNESPQGIKK